MRINKELLRPVNVSLIGFGEMKVLLVDTISLPVVVGSYPRQINKEVNFLVVNCSSSYNAIIRRPTLNSWRVVTSTYHLSVKFPTEYGIGEVQGDQLAARECYLAMMATDVHDWLANVVMVKKANDKWRICVDFTDLNKACPKDSYPLPHFDQLVDSIAGHQ